MIVDYAVAAITYWCMFSNPNISQSGKERCSLFIANCVIVGGGEITTDKRRLNYCIKTGRQRLYGESKI